MRYNTLLGLAALALLAAATLAIAWLPSHAQEKTLPAPAGDDKPPSPELAAVRKTAVDFAAAFNKGDAKAVAAFWTATGEFVAADGEHLEGRDAIEKSYVEFFKENPRAKLVVTVDSVKLLGKHTALEEGTLKLVVPGQKEPSTTKYTVLHVHEEAGWRMASVREWSPDDAELVSLNELAWLIGDWQAKNKDVELRITYAWDPGKTTIQGRYSLKRAGKVESTGTQIIGKDPASGLRSWLFDSSGVFGESSWAREEGHWIIDVTGSLPDGSEITATNILIPLGPDAFTWQSIERTVVGTPLPSTSPLRVTRVPAGK